MDNFAEAVEVAVKEKRVVRELTTLEASVASVKTDAYQEDEPTAGRVTEAAAAAVTTRKEVGDDLAEVLRQLKELLTDNTPAATKRPLPRQRRRPERRGDRRCWKCGVHRCRYIRRAPPGLLNVCNITILYYLLYPVVYNKLST
ncbi:hypothetical protein T08_8349 [Trichinella sp. T8]|nr:hypothetical protein T08_8349 [Trichinella sp. T8]